MPGLLLQMRPSSGEAPCGGVVASPGENLPRDLLLLGLLERRVGGAPAMGRIGGGRFDKSSVQGRAKREGTGRSLPPHVVVTGGGRNQNPKDAPPRKRCGAGIGAMRGRGGRDDRISYLSGLESCLKMRMAFADDSRASKVTRP